MASFLVESYVPEGNVDRFSDDVDGLRAATASMGPSPRTVRYVRSYLVPADEMGFHVMEAPDADAVARVVALAHLDVERVVATIGISADRTGRRS
jgi:hypothetical protein